MIDVIEITINEFEKTFMINMKNYFRKMNRETGKRLRIHIIRGLKNFIRYNWIILI